jgi:hypothetical protein
MYLIGFPLLLIPFAIYNMIAFLFRTGFNDTLFSIPMMSGATLNVTTSDILLILSICLLFIEIVKATRVGMRSIVDHALSFVLFIVMLGEFIMVPRAATSTFLLMLVIAFVDVIGGFSVSLRSAQRDIGIEGVDQMSRS